MTRKLKESVKWALWIVASAKMEKRYAISCYPVVRARGIALIHIPKTAGVSLSQALYGYQIGHLKWHDFYRSNPRHYDALLKFAVCRDPYERFTSAFWFLKNGGMNQVDIDYSRSFLTPFSSPDEFASALADIQFRDLALKKIHFQTQCSFVCDCKGTVMVNHLVNMNRLMVDLRAVLGPRIPDEITYLNRTPRSQNSLSNYSDGALKVLDDIYAHDFKLMRLVAGPRNVFKESIF